MDTIFGIYASRDPNKDPERLIWVCQDQHEALSKAEYLRTNSKQWGKFEVRCIFIEEVLNLILTNGAGFEIL